MKKFIMKYGNIVGIILVLISFIGLAIVACSNVVDPTETLVHTATFSEVGVTPTPTPVLVQVPLFQPRRYIDYQAEVVCYYTPSFDISCVPGNQTKIFTYDLTK